MQRALPCTGQCYFQTHLCSAAQSGSSAALKRDTHSCELSATHGAVCVCCHGLGDSVRTCNSQLSHASPASTACAATSVQAMQCTHASHLYACVEGKGGPAHSLPASPEVAMCQQIRSNVCCSAAGRIRRTRFRDNFDIIVMHVLLLKPDSLMARCEGELPRTANRLNTTAGAHGHVKTRQSSFVICFRSIRLLSLTSTCFLGGVPIYVWNRPPCISPTTPPLEILKPDLPTSFSL
jgi:hypothetical protein